jgi:hypothetical protein
MKKGKHQPKLHIDGKKGAKILKEHNLKQFSIICFGNHYINQYKLISRYVIRVHNKLEICV